MPRERGRGRYRMGRILLLDVSYLPNYRQILRILRSEISSFGMRKAPGVGRTNPGNFREPPRRDWRGRITDKT